MDAKKVEICTLLTEYTDNEVRADASLKGKLIQTVRRRREADRPQHLYVVVGTGKQYEMHQVQCFVDEDNAKTVASLTKGNRVTIRRRVKGLMMNVLVEDCELVEL